jgi:hypothetical protein
MLSKNRPKGETRESAGEDIIGYVLLNNDDNNMNELWEINYTAGHALDVSEVIKSDSLKNNVTRHSGTIEDFLTKERECRNISFHDSMNLPTSIHLKANRSTNHSCTFNPNKKTQSQEQEQVQ